MLQQVTWGQFLLASFLLSFLWYCFVVLVFYRKEVFGPLGNAGSEPLPHRWEKGVENLDHGSDAVSGKGLDVPDSFLGKSAIPEGMSVVGMDKLSFSGGEVSADGRYEQVGLVADVIQELKVIFASLESGDGSKLDFFRLLEKVKEDYGKIGAHPNVSAINGFIASNVHFHLSAEELENLWY